MEEQLGLAPGGLTCLACGDGPIEIHHLRYVRAYNEGRDVFFGDEADEDLVPLCRRDHEGVHRLAERLRELLADYGDPHRALPIATAWYIHAVGGPAYLWPLDLAAKDPARTYSPELMGPQHSEAGGPGLDAPRAWQTLLRRALPASLAAFVAALLVLLVGGPTALIGAFLIVAVALFALDGWKRFGGGAS
jgi:hypothetical protein